MNAFIIHPTACAPSVPGMEVSFFRYALPCPAGLLDTGTYSSTEGLADAPVALAAGEGSLCTRIEH